MKTTMGCLLAAVSLCALPTAAGAAMTYTVTNGKLTSVSGVVVSDKTYDVEFVDGTCKALFGGCDAAADFAFQTLTDANTAAYVIGNKVLLNDVVIGGTTYNFASNPTSVIGFGSRGGDVLVPYGIAGSNALVAAARGRYTEAYTYATNDDAARDIYSVFARFTLMEAPGGGTIPGSGGPGSGGPTPGAGAVPEPATWAMMLAGFGAVGFAMRRRTTRAAVRFA